MALSFEGMGLLGPTLPVFRKTDKHYRASATNGRQGLAPDGPIVDYSERSGRREHEPLDIDVGVRLRRLREMHGLSQRELAKRAGLSNATVSLIEQNRASPSVGSLKRVLDGIPISLADFFALQDTPREQVFFAAEELVEIAGGPLSYRQVGRDLGGRALQVLHERYAPGADTGRELLRHDAEEAGVVVRGRVEVTVGDQRRILGPGEAYYFSSRLPHRFRNLGPEEAEIVSACTPPSF
jgi:transcriptional regulator with XRE-family HTH domain